MSGPDGGVAAEAHFCIYLGAAAGAGKTIAMLDEGRRRRGRGTDVVIAFLESHGRPATERRAAGLETVPRKVVDYRGSSFEEMDLDGVLRRKPEVALIDELAHTNVPGSGHGKRWQDVLELLDSGIRVITTVNIQHLGSIANAVERITKARISERVPDWVVRQADQIELIDSAPEQLRRRMLHGSIYPADQVPQALTHFFRVDNLTVLRELALRFVADESEEELLEFLAHYGAEGNGRTAEHIMAAVIPASGTDAVIRRAAYIAALAKANLDVVYIAGPDIGGQGIALLRQVATEVGAAWHLVHAEDAPSALIEFARSEQITQIVVGASRRGRLQELVSGGSNVARVSRLAARAGIDVHIVALREEQDTARQ